MTTETTQTDILTITLTDRAPIKIRKDEWPVLASARGDSYRGDPGRRRQALQQSECDEYRLTVRQHSDGRAIVYGVVDAAIAAWHAPAGGESWRGGDLLEPGADLASVIRDVGARASMPDSVIRACIADLPAVEI